MRKSTYALSGTVTVVSLGFIGVFGVNIYNDMHANVVDGTAVVSSCVTDDTRRVQHIDTEDGDVKRTRYFNVKGSIAACDTPLVGTAQASGFNRDFSQLLVVREVDGKYRFGWLTGSATKDGKQTFDPIATSTHRIYPGAATDNDSFYELSYGMEGEPLTMLVPAGCAPLQPRLVEVVYVPTGARCPATDFAPMTAGDQDKTHSAFKDGYGFKSHPYGLLFGTEEELANREGQLIQNSSVYALQPIKVYDRNSLLAFAPHRGVVKVDIKGDRVTTQTVFDDGQSFTTTVVTGPNNSVLYVNYDNGNVRLYTAELGSRDHGNKFATIDGKHLKHGPVSVMAFTD